MIGRGAARRMAPPPPNPAAPIRAHEQRMQAVNAVAGYAMGTPSVPGPGQTITSGSWEGPTGPATPPPAPLTGQNQDLRSKVFGTPPIKRFAGGTTDVSNPPPAPGQTVTSGTWTPPNSSGNGGQNQDLRAKLKGMGYADGTADVPTGSPAAAQSGFNAPPQGPGLDLRGLLSRIMTEPNTYQPPMPAVAPGSLAATQGGFNALPPAPAPVSAATAGPIQGPQAGPSSQLVEPSILEKFSSFLFGAAQPQTQIVHADGSTKVPDDPHKVGSVSTALGVPPGYAHAMLEPHQYTEQEFLGATQGMSTHQLEKLWQMQHYLNPEQQITPLLVGHLQQQIAESEAAAAAAAQKGDPAALKQANDVLALRKNDLLGFLQKKSLGQSYMYPTMGQPLQ